MAVRRCANNTPQKTQNLSQFAYECKNSLIWNFRLSDNNKYNARIYLIYETYYVCRSLAAFTACGSINALKSGASQISIRAHFNLKIITKIFFCLCLEVSQPRWKKHPTLTRHNAAPTRAQCVETHILCAPRHANAARTRAHLFTACKRPSLWLFFIPNGGGADIYKLLSLIYK